MHYPILTNSADSTIIYDYFQVIILFFNELI